MSVADIFFSYTKADRARIQPLIAALKEQNWTVWWDSNIYGGDSWSDVIEAELTEARCVIVAWSQLSAKSAWVKEEARTASKGQKLVPVLLDSMDPPFGFGGIQAVDLSGWTKDKDALEFQSLCAAVQGKLDPQSPGQSVSRLPIPTVKPIVPQRLAWPKLAIGAVGTVLGAIAVAAFLFLSREKYLAPKPFVVGVQEALCVLPDGLFGVMTTLAIRDYLTGMGRQIPALIDPGSPEVMPALQSAVNNVGDCTKAGFQNAFEVGRFGVAAEDQLPAARTKDFQTSLLNALKSKNSPVTFEVTGELDAPTRRGIAEFRQLSNMTSGDSVDLQFVNSVKAASR
jgi:hypothetical protein